MMSRARSPRRWWLAVAGMALMLLATFPAAAQERTLRLLAHSSFFLPQETIEAFEQTHDVKVKLDQSYGDAVVTLNRAILTRDRPIADVLFGVDNTLLSRALVEDIFVPHDADGLDAVPPEFVLDPEHRVTPIDYGDVCVNLDRASFADGRLPEPRSLEDLADPALAGTLVVQNPAMSSPGLAFLLATVAHFGEDPETGWRSYWQRLRDNDVRVVNGWETAYFGDFSGGPGAGDRPLVVSYATSPAAEIDAATDESRTASLDAGCFRQIEFAGVLRGASEPELAGAFIDFLLAPETQSQFPENMFVYPARVDVSLPEAFARHAPAPSMPLSLDPDVIAEGRERWIREWTDIVLR